MIQHVVAFVEHIDRPVLVHGYGNRVVEARESGHRLDFVSFPGRRILKVNLQLAIRFQKFNLFVLRFVIFQYKQVALGTERNIDGIVQLDKLIAIVNVCHGRVVACYKLAAVGRAHHNLHNVQGNDDAINDLLVNNVNVVIDRVDDELGGPIKLHFFNGKTSIAAHWLIGAAHVVKIAYQSLNNTIGTFRFNFISIDKVQLLVEIKCKALWILQSVRRTALTRAE